VKSGRRPACHRGVKSGQLVPGARSADLPSAGLIGGRRGAGADYRRAAKFRRLLDGAGSPERHCRPAGWRAVRTVGLLRRLPLRYRAGPNGVLPCTSDCIRAARVSLLLPSRWCSFRSLATAITMALPPQEHRNLRLEQPSRFAQLAEALEQASRSLFQTKYVEPGSSQCLTAAAALRHYKGFDGPRCKLSGTLKSDDTAAAGGKFMLLDPHLLASATGPTAVVFSEVFKDLANPRPRGGTSVCSRFSTAAPPSAAASCSTPAAAPATRRCSAGSPGARGAVRHRRGLGRRHAGLLVVQLFGPKRKNLMTRNAGGLESSR
jgi:hypothetical protein